MTRRRLVLALAAAAALLPSDALAAAWLPPVVPSGGASLRPSIAFPKTGEVITAFDAPASGANRILVSIRPPAGDFPNAAIIGADDTVDARGASVAAADDGSAVLVWARPDSSDPLHYALRAPGGAFGAPRELADAGHGAVASPTVVMNARGDALAVWQRKDASDILRVWASLKPAGGTFDTPVAVSAADGCEPRGAIGAGGQAAVAFIADCLNLMADGGGVSVARRAPGANWGGAEAVTPSDERVGSLAVVVDGQGNTTVAWDRTKDGPGRVRAASAPPNGTFATFGSDLGDQNGFASGPALGVADDGTALLAFRERASGQNERVRLTAIARGATGFGPVADLSDPALEAQPPVISVRGDGTALVVWSRNATLEYVLRTPAGAISPAGVVSSGGDATNIALAQEPSGNAAVAFERTGSVQVQGYDPVPPTVLSTLFPAATVTGKPITVETAAADLWGIAFVTVDWGDGTPASTGVKAVHTYGKAGRYTLGITVADAAGNATKVVGTITVSTVDTTRPSITRLRVSPRRPRVGQRVRFRYRISEPALVGFTVTRLDRGRRVGGQCAPEDPELRRRRGCTLRTEIGSFTRSHAKPGTQAVRLPNRIGGRRLRAGRYRITLRARDAVGLLSRTKTVSLTVRAKQR